MNIVRLRDFGPVTALELGFGPIGAPWMTVHMYRIGDLLIDTGQRHMQAAVMAHLADRPPAAVALTHHHEDHSGNAAAISRRFGVPIYLNPLDAGKLAHGYRIRFYQHYVWGAAEPTATRAMPETLDGGRYRLNAIHTPGHSRDHTVFFEAGNGWLFSGDLYLGDRIKYFRADESFADQILSLRRVLTLDFDALFCAHRPVASGGKARLRKKLEFLEECRHRVRELLAAGCPAKEIRRRLDPGDDRRVRWITYGNVSFAHLVRAILRDEPLAAGTDRTSA